MKISSINLEAFYALSQTLNFSVAALKIGLTQSALSQRIAKIEDQLEVTLFIRDSKNVTLTTSGLRLLRYCQVHAIHENNFLSELFSDSTQLKGTIRIAAFSSVLRSLIIPALNPLKKSNPEINFEFSCLEVIDLYPALQQAKCDIAILDYQLKKSGIVEHIIGHEEYVVIKSKKLISPDVYLDHGPHDNATESFFLAQSDQPKIFRRTFMGDVYGIIDGVELGYGQAVMSRHLIKNNKNIKILSKYKKYFRPITLNFFESPYYSKLHLAVVEQLILHSKKILNQH